MCRAHDAVVPFCLGQSKPFAILFLFMLRTQSRVLLSQNPAGSFKRRCEGAEVIFPKKPAILCNCVSQVDSPQNFSKAQ